MVVRLIEAGDFTAFPDTLRFIIAVKDAGIRVAAASSSKNAKLFLGVGVTRPDHHLLNFQRSIERLSEGIIGDTSAPG
jgi:hypothetical protein